MAHKHAWYRASAHVIVLLLCTRLASLGSAGNARSGIDPLCHDNPSVNCAFLDHSAQICTAFPDSEETKSYCPKYCKLCVAMVATYSSTIAGSAGHLTSRYASHVTTAGSVHVTGAPAGTTTAPFTGPCVDDPNAKCADLDHTAHICTLYRNDPTTRTSCPNYCGLCTGHVTTGGSVHVTGAPVGTTTAPFNGPCVDDPAAKCADLDHTAHICTLYRNDPTTRTSCPKYCGLCGDGHVTTGGSGHVTGAPAGTTTAPFTGPCVDDPAAKCADLDNTAHICTLYRNDPTTRTSCPKYCGLCGAGHVTTGGSVHVTGAPVGTTTAPFNGPCVDDPAAKCADLDHTAHICTLYRNDPTTRTSCPKYCGLCGDGHVTTGGSGHVTVAPAGTTTAPFTGPCVDDPAAKCADLDHTAHICTLYRNDPTTRTSCPKYCGLCGAGHVTTGGSVHVTGAPVGTTTAPFNGPCVDDPAAKCADLDHTAHICTLYRNDPTTRTSCPKYCGLCGDGHVTTGGSGHVTGAPAGTTTAPFTGPCVDDPAAKCADLDNTAHICTLYRNDPTTRTSCPKYCGLCGAGHVTTGGSVHVTGAPVGTTTAPFNGPCVDDPAAKCADLDHTAHICTLYRNDPTTRTSCPKYCGLCGAGHVTTGGSGHVTGALAGTTTAPFTGQCVDDPAAKCADLDHTAHICTLYRNDPTTRTSCPKYCGLCGAGLVTTGGSSHVTGAPVGTTTDPFTGPCVDDPDAKCADLDHTAHICTLYRDDPTTRTSCPKYCGLCGAGHLTTGGSGLVTGEHVGTTADPFTGPCVDDPDAKCADLDHTAHICTLYRDDPTTRTSCPKYCGLCGAGHLTTGGSGHVTGAPAGTTTAPLTGQCVDDPDAKCADLDHTAHICTLYRNDPTTRTSCPKYCGLCGDGRYTGGVITTHSILSTRGLTTISHTNPSTNHLASQSTTEFPESTKHITETTTHSKTTTHFKTTGSVHVTTTESEPPTKRQTTTHRLSTSTEVTGPSSTASHESLVLQAFHKEDLNKDGSVSFAEFERVWQIMDVNRDGRVTEAEYSRGTHFSRLVSTEVFSLIDRDHNLAITLQELPYIFTLFDTDYSGSIEREEYIKEYSKIYNHVQNSLH